MPESSGLSALERRVLALREAGLDEAEIAVKFRRSPRFIRQVLAIGELKRGVHADGGDVRDGTLVSTGGMSPRQRIVLKWRARGASYAEIASRLRRSPLYVRRIERMAHSRSA